jgi:hypothetical protein
MVVWSFFFIILTANRESEERLKVSDSFINQPYPLQITGSQWFITIKSADEWLLDEKPSGLLTEIELDVRLCANQNNI